MKVTFVLPHAGISGGVKVVAIYADKLQRLGHSVTVVSLPAPRPNLGRYVKSLLLGRPWPRREASAPFFTNPDVSHHILERARPITDGDVPDADVVIATWWETADWVLSLNASKGRKVYLVQGHETFAGLPLDRVRATYKYPMHKLVVSDWLLRLMYDEYQQSQVTLIENGVDVDFFRVSSRTKGASTTVGFLYSASRVKRSDIALDAIRMAKLQFPELRAVCFGAARPSPEDNFPDWAEFHLRPPQLTIPSLYARCDAWLFTSETEGFGLPILEAMACGTPVIATPAGAAQQLITDQSGYIVPLNAEAIASKIAEVAGMPSDAWRGFSEAARRNAEGHSWDHAADLLHKTLMQIAFIERPQILGDGPETQSGSMHKAG